MPGVKKNVCSGRSVSDELSTPLTCLFSHVLYTNMSEESKSSLLEMHMDKEKLTEKQKTTLRAIASTWTKFDKGTFLIVMESRKWGRYGRPKRSRKRVCSITRYSKLTSNHSDVSRASESVAKSQLLPAGRDARWSLHQTRANEWRQRLRNNR